MICNDKFTYGKPDYSVIFDDDGRVAYAYLLEPRGNFVSDVSVYWLYSGVVEAGIILRDKLFATLAEDCKSGCCSMAKKRSPLAKVLVV